MLFKRKKREDFLTSDEYESLSKKIVNISTDLEMQEAKINRLDSDFRSLRARVLRFKKEEEEEEDLNNSDGLDGLRRINKSRLGL